MDRVGWLIDWLSGSANVRGLKRRMRRLLATISSQNRKSPHGQWLGWCLCMRVCVFSRGGWWNSRGSLWAFLCLMIRGTGLMIEGLIPKSFWFLSRGLSNASWSSIDHCTQQSLWIRIWIWSLAIALHCIMHESIVCLVLGQVHTGRTVALCVCVCPWEVNVNLMGKISSNVLVQCHTVCVGRGTNTAGQNTSGYMCLMLNYSTSNYMHSTPCSIPL